MLNNKNAENVKKKRIISKIRWGNSFYTPTYFKQNDFYNNACMDYEW